MCTRQTLYTQILITLLVGISTIGHAEKSRLSDFESDVRTPQKHHAPSKNKCDSLHESHRESHANSCISDLLGELLFKTVGFTLLYGGLESWSRVSDYEASSRAPEARHLGQPLIPFARLDLSYQYVESDIDALDLRTEAGYGPFGIHVNATRYQEHDPNNELDMIRVAGLYRMSFGPYVETQLGFGSLAIDGQHSTSRFLFTTPVLVHPHENWGIEFRPTWSENIQDYDLALMMTFKHTSLKLGYRWLISPNQNLDGPYAGISMRL